MVIKRLEKYTISDATIDDEYKGNRIYPKTIISLFKEKPNIIINSVFRSPEAQKAWIYLLSNLPPNIGKSVKYYKDEDTTLFQLKSRNLRESIKRILREETELDKEQLKKIKIVKNFINTLYPNFNKESVKIEKRIMDPLAYQKRFEDIRYEYRDLETNKYYAIYHEKNKELQLNKKIFESLEDYLGDEIMEYIIDWFNYEFNKNAESFTF